MGNEAIDELDGNYSMPAGQGLQTATYSYHADELAGVARGELNGLLLQRAELTKRIGTLKRTLAGLAWLLGSPAPLNPRFALPDGKTRALSPSSLTDACRMALMHAGTPLRAHQVRDKLRFQCSLFENHRDPVATISTILRRLCQYGEARSVILPDGKRVWEWVCKHTQRKKSARVRQSVRRVPWRCWTALADFILKSAHTELVMSANTGANAVIPKGRIVPHAATKSGEDS